MSERARNQLMPRLEPAFSLKKRNEKDDLFPYDSKYSLCPFIYKKDKNDFSMYKYNSLCLCPILWLAGEKQDSGNMACQAVTNPVQETNFSIPILSPYSSYYKTKPVFRIQIRKFLASRIWIRYSEVGIRIRIRIISSLNKNSKKNLDFYSFVPSL
jgi:hypothetical protein